MDDISTSVDTPPPPLKKRSKRKEKKKNTWCVNPKCSAAQRIFEDAFTDDHFRWYYPFRVTHCSTSQPARTESDISESDRPRMRPLIVVLHAMRFTGMPAFALLLFPRCRRDLWGCRRDLRRRLCRRGKWLLCRGRWAFRIFRRSRGVHRHNTLQTQSSARSPRTGLCGSAQAWRETFQ